MGEEIINEGIVELKLLTRNKMILDARREKGLSQKDLSIITGIPIDKISQIENLKLIPLKEVMCEISSALEKPVEFLFPPELLQAIGKGVFQQRKVVLGAGQVVALSESKDLEYQFLISDGGLEKVEKKTLRDYIVNMPGILTNQEREVIISEFGLGDDGLTREELGKKIGVSRQSIYGIRDRALEKMRRHRRRFEDFYD